MCLTIEISVSKERYGHLCESLQWEKWPVRETKQNRKEKKILFGAHLVRPSVSTFVPVEMLPFIPTFLILNVSTLLWSLIIHPTYYQSLSALPGSFPSPESFSNPQFQSTCKCLSVSVSFHRPCPVLKAYNGNYTVQMWQKLPTA